MKVTKKRLLSLLLAAVMALTLLPVTAFAEEPESAEPTAPVSSTAPEGEDPAAEGSTEPAPVACTKTDGCTLAEGHEGECAVVSAEPAEPRLAADRISDSVWTAYAAVEFAGGTGTEQDPYQIATAEQLAKLSKDVSEGTNYQGSFFKLTENIDLSSYRWAPIGIWRMDGSGTTNKSFQGFLDGNHKTISGLMVDESTDKNAAGLFGNIRNVSSGTVGAKDLTISGANISANEDGLDQLYAGILAGYALANPGEQVVFENISVSGAVVIESTDGNNNVGGMIGYGDRIKATNCKAENISVTGASNSGGFIGLAGGSAFENCKVSGTVSGTWALGGFVGYSYSATVDGTEPSVYEKCAADVKIEGSDWRLGGFAGYAEHGMFADCVALGNVASTVDGWNPKVGGFIGESGEVNADDCHAAGAVTSESSDYDAGGFVGDYEGGTFENCSFDSEKNNGLDAAGTGTISSGVDGGNSNGVLANICEDYYGGHQYSTEWTVDTVATCTTDGSKSQHCERCNAKGNITVIPAPGHSLTKVEEKPATHTEDGHKAYWTCSGCDKLFADENCAVIITAPEVIPSPGHSFGIEWKSDADNHWHECACGEKADVAAHTFGDWTTIKAATATEAGSREKSCTTCGYKVTESIPATGTGTGGGTTTTPTDPPKPTPETNAGSNTPQTGDPFSAWPFVGLLFISAAGLIMLMVAQAKRRKDAE